MTFVVWAHFKLIRSSLLSLSVTSTCAVFLCCFCVLLIDLFLTLLKFLKNGLLRRLVDCKRVIVLLDHVLGSVTVFHRKHWLRFEDVFLSIALNLLLIDHALYFLTHFTVMERLQRLDLRIHWEGHRPDFVDRRDLVDRPLILSLALSHRRVL